MLREHSGSKPPPNKGGVIFAQNGDRHHFLGQRNKMVTDTPYGPAKQPADFLILTDPVERP